MRSLSVLPFVLGLLVSTLFSIGHGRSAWAVGVLYNDPGWYYSYDGNEAFYNDLDGPNPDYINGTDANSPGGQSGTPALVDPRVLDPGCNPSQAGNCADAEWTFKSSQWDGTAPGDPLGGVPTGTPPIIPAGGRFRQCHEQFPAQRSDPPVVARRATIRAPMQRLLQFWKQ